MNNVKEQILNLIRNENKSEAFIYSQNALKEKKLTIRELYEDVLRNALYEIDCLENDAECIWKEHVKSAIVRSIIEGSYTYVLEESKLVKKRNKKVLVVCPVEEYHEIGAKMAHDYFLLTGFDATFIGANTPLDVILNAVTYTKPDYLAISVTNYYNIINAKRIIEKVKSVKENIVILGGGQAFGSQDALDTCKVDIHIKTFDDIQGIK